MHAHVVQPHRAVGNATARAAYPVRPGCPPRRHTSANGRMVTRATDKKEVGGGDVPLEGGGLAVGSAAPTPIDVDAIETAAVPVKRKPRRQSAPGSDGLTLQSAPGPIVLVAKPLARVLLLHTGGTLGMDSHASYEEDPEGSQHLVPGTGGKYHAQRSLKPGNMLSNLLGIVPELRQLANLDLKVVFNRDSCNVGPKEWVHLAKTLDANRRHYDAFLVVHGTDTMAYSAAATSLMLAGFRKPVVFTGSQLPLAMPRSDARQNLIDSLTCATCQFNPPHVKLQEVAICFGGRLLRGNRTRKENSNVYEAFESPSYPELARMGVEVEWATDALLEPEGVYRPRFRLDPAVVRVPIVPGVDPRQAYGDLVGRGVRGIVLESFGVGNMPNTLWLPWLRQQRRAGLLVSMVSQCSSGALQPDLYASGAAALALGVEAGPQMTPETAAVKLMLCLQYPDLPLGVPLAGEM